MKVEMIVGSRNPAGKTARAAKAMLEGMGGGAAAGEPVFLPGLAIERCRQCDDAGWGICRSEGRCVIKDDFAGLVDRIRKADTVIFANPVYFGDLSESLRAFLDRLRRITRHDEGKKGITGKRAAGICVAGGGGGGAPACAVSLEKVLTTCGFDVVDMVPVRRQNLETKLELLRRTGQWLATGPSSQDK